MSVLMCVLVVESRFQLGYEMGKRGISGRETDEPTS